MILDQEGIISTHLGERERERGQENQGRGQELGQEMTTVNLSYRQEGKNLCSQMDEGAEGSEEHRCWEPASSGDGWNQGLHCFLNVFQVMYQSQAGHRAISLTVMFRR